MKIINIGLTCEKFNKISDLERAMLLIKLAQQDHSIDSEDIDKALYEYNCGFIMKSQLYGWVIECIADQFDGIVLFKFIKDEDFGQRIKKAKLLEKMVGIYKELKEEIDPVTDPNILWETAVRISKRMEYLKKTKEESI